MHKHQQTLASSVLLCLLSATSWQAYSGDILDEIIATKTLKVGVTGDYMPFSEKLEDGRYIGIEHDIAAEIAAYLGVSIELVPTSWPTLMQDFHQGRYHLGMTGISINDERQRTAYFSTPYYVYGKTPITLCENATKFDSLEKIDQPSTTVIINEGGTNAKFARTTLKNAKLHVEPTNKHVYDRILDGTVDLMIPDSVEADYRAANYPELCRSMPDFEFTQSSIGTMMAKDSELKAAVDKVLEKLTTSGELERIIATNMNTKI
ncbi:transporter substrate-binding domain-containing protein [Vibrio sp. WXL210]|uniref:transporter substrate-binding domain-containing protein n=1 Tax=Vibrio sp. WXL210 TaxID=3450709 RepID=UPI003EC75353